MDWAPQKYFNLNMRFDFYMTFKMRCNVIGVHLMLSAYAQTIIFDAFDNFWSFKSYGGEREWDIYWTLCESFR